MEVTLTPIIDATYIYHRFGIDLCVMALQCQGYTRFAYISGLLRKPERKPAGLVYWSECEW